MKKLIRILTPFLLLNSIALTGCQKKDGRVLLSFGDIHATESRSIELDYLDNAINAKENFLLVVSTTTCGCWDEFQATLNPYLKKNKALCYQISYNQISNKDVAASYGLTMVSKSTTTFAIFENGEIKTYLNTSKNSETMYTTKKFEKYMSQTVRLPSCFFINKDDVTKIKNSKKNAVIYFERNGCSDCSALNPGILRKYIENHDKMQKIYVLDCEEYYRKQGQDGYDDYLKLKKDLGLAKETNPTFGYQAGVFPFFSFISQGKYASGSVIYNDSLTKEDNKYKITESYYTSESVKKLQYTNTVIQGKTVPASDVTAYGTWKNDKADAIYEDILNSFLDYALPKTTFTF